MELYSSPIPPPVRVRRVSRYELENLFPTLSNNRVGSTLSTSPPNSQITINRQNFEFENNGQLNQPGMTRSKLFKLQRKQSIRQWCAIISAIIALMVLGGIIATIINLLIKEPVTMTTTVTTVTTTTQTTMTSSTSSTTTTTETTSSTTSTSSSSSSTSTSSSSTSSSTSTSSTTSTSETTSTTSTSSTSTTTTSTTSSTSSTTSFTSSTSTSSTTTTTQDPQIGSVDDASAVSNTWTPRVYSYTATTSGTLTLEFTMRVNNKCKWYLDDISIRDPTSIEMLTNGDFESGLSPTGWTSTSPVTCGSDFNVTATHSYSGSRSFRHCCDNHIGSISQSFTAIHGDIYNVSFWYLFTCDSGSGTAGPINLLVNIN